MRADLARSEVSRLVRQSPFIPFVLNMENGDHLLVEHPENIAFELDGNGEKKSLPDFCVFSRRLRYYGFFEAVTGISMADNEYASGGSPNS